MYYYDARLLLMWIGCKAVTNVSILWILDPLAAKNGFQQDDVALLIDWSRTCRHQPRAMSVRIFEFRCKLDNSGWVNPNTFWGDVANRTLGEDALHIYPSQHQVQEAYFFNLLMKTISITPTSTCRQILIISMSQRLGKAERKGSLAARLDWKELSHQRSSYLFPYRIRPI